MSRKTPHTLIRVTLGGQVAVFVEDAESLAKANARRASAEFRDDPAIRVVPSSVWHGGEYIHEQPIRRSA